MQPRAEETRRAILAVARDLFAQYGVDATSIERIRAEAYISRGAFYHHFASKQDLILELAKEQAPAIQERFEVLVGSEATTRQLLAATMRIFARELSAMPHAVARSVACEMVRAWTEPGAAPPGLRANLEVVLERGRRRGDLPSGCGAGDLAAVAFGAAYATLIEWLADPADAGVSLEERLVRRGSLVLLAATITVPEHPE